MVLALSQRSEDSSACDNSEPQNRITYFSSKNMSVIQKLLTFALLAKASAYSGTSSPRSSRRDVLNKLATGTLFGVVSVASSANALEICPPKANNCVRTVWKAPEGTSKDDSVKALLEAINAYPQAGQADVDGGGWTIAEDDLAVSGTVRVEYKSSGKGNFAKFFNGGKPFVDDLKLEVESNGNVQVKSQSRVGDSDFGVNTKVSVCLKRLSFIPYVSQLNRITSELITWQVC